MHLAQHDLEYLVDDVSLVVSELATNSLMHAHTPFTVVLEASERTVRLAVEDGSPSGLMRTKPLALDTRGRGIGIVESLSLDWGVSSHPVAGKAVWAEFDAGVTWAREGVPAVPLGRRQRKEG